MIIYIWIYIYIYIYRFCSGLYRFRPLAEVVSARVSSVTNTVVCLLLILTCLIVVGFIHMWRYPVKVNIATNRKWHCLRTVASLYKHLFFIDIYIYIYILLYIIIYIWLCAKSFLFVLCPFALLLWARPPGVQKSKIYGIWKTRNWIWIRVVQFSCRDICSPMVSRRTNCFFDFTATCFYGQRFLLSTYPHAQEL